MSDASKRSNTAAEHMATFYRPFAEVADSGEKFDGLIITGAPIEHLPFEEVTYWPELCARSWTGPRPMCNPPSASAGAAWR